MIKIAVTGGIGSGKSYISHLLENMHIPVYNADNEAKRLTVFDAGIRGELIALLGEEVYKVCQTSRCWLPICFPIRRMCSKSIPLSIPGYGKILPYGWNVRKSVR